MSLLGTDGFTRDMAQFVSDLARDIKASETGLRETIMRNIDG